jgi:hypothetical protein
MRGIQVGGGRHGDAPMTELEHPLDFMPVKHMPDRLTQLECLKARIWVRLMTVPASGIRESSLPGRFADVSETAKPMDVSRDVFCRHGKPGTVQ